MNALRFPALGDIPVRYREQVAGKLGVRTHRIEPAASLTKYKNQRGTYQGEKFDSLKELARWKELQLLEKAGKITKLRRQVSYQLKVRGVEICVYRADAVFERGGETVVEDTKGMRKGVPYSLFKVKAKLMLACHRISVLEV